jgi:hypothetical protein
MLFNKSTGNEIGFRFGEEGGGSGDSYLVKS